MALIAFSQYLIRFPIALIEQFISIDQLYKKKPSNILNIERESMLIQFKAFQEIHLDDFIKDLRNILNPFFYYKNLDYLSKLKLQEVIISSINSEQIIFQYSFSYVFKLPVHRINTKN